MIRAFLAAAAAALIGLAPGAAAAPPPGRLVGSAVISFGCPGPQREGLDCLRWTPFARARLSVDGRLVVADSSGRFTLRLSPGAHVVKPLAQPHAKAGAPLVVRIRSGAMTKLVVRFSGSATHGSGRRLPFLAGRRWTLFPGRAPDPAIQSP